MTADPELELAAIKDELKSADPKAKIAVPCRFHPHCRPRNDRACRFAHVSKELRSKYSDIEDRANLARSLAYVEIEMTRIDRESHCAMLWRTLIELGAIVPKFDEICMSITYSVNGGALNTDYVRIPYRVSTWGNIVDAVQACEIQFTAVNVGVRVASRGIAVATETDGALTANFGHPVRSELRVAGPYLRRVDRRW